MENNVEYKIIHTYYSKSDMQLFGITECGKRVVLSVDVDSLPKISQSFSEGFSGCGSAGVMVPFIAMGYIAAITR